MLLASLEVELTKITGEKDTHLIEFLQVLGGLHKRKKTGRMTRVGSFCTFETK